mgnify:FL=1
MSATVDDADEESPQPSHPRGRSSSILVRPSPESRSGNRQRVVIQAASDPTPAATDEDSPFSRDPGPPSSERERRPSSSEDHATGTARPRSTSVGGRRMSLREMRRMSATQAMRPETASQLQRMREEEEAAKKKAEEEAAAQADSTDDDESDQSSNSSGKGDDAGAEDEDDDPAAHLHDRIACFRIPRHSTALQSSSLYFIGQDNPVRRFLYGLCHHKAFESFIIGCILLNCAVLALDDATRTDDPIWVTNLNYFFITVFSAELVIKVISFGFVLHPGAYLRNHWNQLDCIIVILSYLQLIPGFGNFTAFRVLRVLRPLRSMNAIPPLRFLVTILLKSVAGLVNVFMLALFLFSIFGIFGVQLFQGSLRYRCVDPFTNISTAVACHGAEVTGFLARDCVAPFQCRNIGVNPNYGMTSFDNILWALLIIMQTITLEAWSALMYDVMDAVSALAAIYFVLLVLFGAYLVLQLALAVISAEFEFATEQAEEQAAKEAEALQGMKVNKKEAARKKASLERSGMANTEEIPAEYLAKLIRIPDAVLATGGSFRSKKQPLSKDDSSPPLGDGAVRPSTVALPTSPLDATLRTGGSATNNTTTVENKSTASLVSPTSPTELAVGVVSPKTDISAPSPLSTSMKSPRRKTIRIQDKRTTDDPTGDDAAAAASSCGMLTRMRRHLYRVIEGDPDIEIGKDQEKTTLFAKFILICIFINTGLLAADHYGAPPLQERISSYCNIVFSAIFALEMTLKVVAMGPKAYVSDAFNCFDAIIVTISIVELSLGSGARFSVFRTFRLLRIFKLLKNFPSLLAIVNVLLFAIRDTLFLMVLLFLYLFIASLVGMQFFGGQMDWENSLNPEVRSTFDDFPAAFLTVFQVLTRDNWPTLMTRAMAVTSPAAATYFIFAVFTGDLVILNLFLSVVISSFDNVGKPAEDLAEKERRKEEASAAARSRKRMMSVTLTDGLQGKITDFSQLQDGSPLPGERNAKLLSKSSATVLLTDAFHPELVKQATTRSEMKRQEDEQRRQRQDAADKEEEEGSSDPPADSSPLLPVQSGPSRSLFEDPDDELMGSPPFGPAGRGGSNTILGAGIRTLAQAAMDRKDNTMGTKEVGICSKCGDAIYEPLPTPSRLVVAPTPQELHDRICDRVQVRKAKEAVIASILDELQMRIERARRRVGRQLPTTRDVEDLFGRAWEVGLLLGDDVSEQTASPSWEKLRKAILDERKIVRLHVGEDQIGGSLISYTKANVPNELKTNGGTSLWLFGKRNTFRILCTRFVYHPIFDRFILLCILVSSILLAFDDPRTAHDDPTNILLNQMGYFFTAVFTAEMVLKIIANGFVLHPTAYIRDWWNVLDFITVLVALISLAITSVDVSFLKVLRTFRAVRPLRVINRNRGLKMVVITLLESLKGIANVAMITLLIWLVFAILGTQLYGGRLYTCTDGSKKTKTSCQGWHLTPLSSFATDNSGFMDLSQTAVVLRSSSGVNDRSVSASSPLLLGVDLNTTTAKTPASTTTAATYNASSTDLLPSPPEEGLPDLATITAAWLMPTIEDATLLSPVQSHAFYGAAYAYYFPWEVPSAFNPSPASSPTQAHRMFRINISSDDVHGSPQSDLSDPSQRNATDIIRRARASLAALWSRDAALPSAATAAVNATRRATLAAPQWTIATLLATVFGVSSSPSVDSIAARIASMCLFGRAAGSNKTLRSYVDVFQLIFGPTQGGNSSNSAISTTTTTTSMFNATLTAAASFITPSGAASRHTLTTFTHLVALHALTAFNDTRRWENFAFNFDNSYNSFLTLLTLGSLDDVATKMYKLMDTTDVDLAPERNASPWNCIYIIVFVIVGSFFLLGMFVGVVIFQYNKTKTSLDGLSLLTPQQKHWVETQRMVLNYRPSRRNEAPYCANEKRPSLRRQCFNIVEHTNWEIATGILTALNILFIAVDDYSAPAYWNDMQDYANYVFVGIFSLEAIFKIFALGPQYFLDSWNRLDFVLALLGIFTSSFKFIDINTNTVRVLRVLRLMRLLSLVNKAKQLRILLETLYFSLPSLINVSLFLVLLFFIFAVLGVQLFAQVKARDGIDNRWSNFQGFVNSFLMLIRVTTFDNWGTVMATTSRVDDCGPDDCGTIFAPLYYVIFIILGSFVMLNVIVAVILDNFNTTMRLDHSKVKVMDLKRFSDAWSKHDPQATLQVETKYFPQIICALKPPLGIARRSDRLDLLRLAQSIQVPEHAGVIHFIETLVPLARRAQRIECEERNETVEFNDRDIRDHEDEWKDNFPQIADLPVLRYRQKRIGVEHYLAAVYIESAYRRSVAQKFFIGLQRRHINRVRRAYDEQGVPEAQRDVLHRIKARFDARPIPRGWEHHALDVGDDDEVEDLASFRRRNLERLNNKGTGRSIDAMDAMWQSWQAGGGVH